MFLDYEKAQEIAARYRGYKDSKKPMYFKMFIKNASTGNDFREVHNDRLIASEAAFNRIMQDVLANQKPYEIQIIEYSGETSGAKTLGTIFIKVRAPETDGHLPVSIIRKEKEEDIDSRSRQIYDSYAELGGIEGIENRARESALKEFQQLQDQRELEQLRIKVKQLEEDNDKLYDANGELGSTNEKLLKHVPHSLKVPGTEVSFVDLLTTVATGALGNLVEKLMPAGKQHNILAGNNIEKNNVEMEIEGQIPRSEKDKKLLDLFDFAQKNIITDLEKLRVIYNYFLHIDENQNFVITEENLNDLVSYIQSKANNNKPVRLE